MFLEKFRKKKEACIEASSVGIKQELKMRSSPHPHSHPSHPAPPRQFINNMHLTRSYLVEKKLIDSSNKTGKRHHHHICHNDSHKDYMSKLI